MYNSTVNISPTNRKSHVGFRLPDFNLTLTYSKGQLGSWNGVLQILYDYSCVLVKKIRLESAKTSCRTAGSSTPRDR